MSLNSLLLLVAVTLPFFTTLAETVKDRAGAVLEDRARMETDARWIYNDWQKGFARAKETGKPLLVVLRCVPCLACKGIDAGVLTQTELNPLLSQFVCVRVMNANTLDLSLFQFDYDLSFSAMFFNADGTVYGRFGSWTHQKNTEEGDTASFRQALEGALQLHKAYPANKLELKGKQGLPSMVADPLELPQLAGKYKRELDWKGKVVQSCVHCHQIGDGTRSLYRSSKKTIPLNLIYPMPAPETIGITLASDQLATVAQVIPGSIAANAGLKTRDVILTLASQPLTSIADFSWVLHNLPDEGVLKARVRRDNNEREIDLFVPSGWRYKSDISQRVGTWPMRAMAAGGLQLTDLTDEERAIRQLDREQMALLVKHAGEYGEHAAAKKAGFRKGDILVQIGSRRGRITESELIGRLLQEQPPGAQLSTTVLRDSERMELMLPIQ